MNKEITILGKDIETQNNEKFRLNSTMRVFDSQANERREASNNLQIVMAGFKSSVNVGDQSNVKMLIDHIKANMTATNSTPLVGQDLTGIHDNKAVSLGIKLSQESIHKLGKFKPNYESCVHAQKRYNSACAIYSNMEKEYGNLELIKSKLAKVQNNVDTCSQRIEQIWAVFQSLDSEF